MINRLQATQDDCAINLEEWERPCQDLVWSCVHPFPLETGDNKNQNLTWPALTLQASEFVLAVHSSWELSSQLSHFGVVASSNKLWSCVDSVN